MRITNGTRAEAVREGRRGDFSAGALLRATKAATGTNRASREGPYQFHGLFGRKLLSRGARVRKLPNLVRFTGTFSISALQKAGLMLPMSPEGRFLSKFPFLAERRPLKGRFCRAPRAFRKLRFAQRGRFRRSRHCCECQRFKCLNSKKALREFEPKRKLAEKRLH